LTAPEARGFFRSVRRLAARVSLSVFSLVSLRLASATAAPATDKAAEALSTLEKDKAHGALLADPLRRAKDAFDRARSMDAAGDAAHAATMREVAREWVELASDLVRAADAEARAVQAEKDLDEVETKLVRGRALLEETVARRGRAREALEQLEREPKPAPPDPKKVKGAKPVAPKAAPAASKPATSKGHAE
jgi:hypothetical protein